MNLESGNADDYVLGTHEDEAFRLGLQHALWSEYAHKIWKRAGIVYGSKVLDAGSGPGFATMDLARIVGDRGQVTAVEYAPVFVSSLEATLAKDGVPGVDASCVQVVQGDLQEITLEPSFHDAAYLRWVLCFLNDPQGALRNIGASIKSGGTIAIQDYSNFIGALTLHPKSEAFDKLVSAFHDSWIASGGNPRVGLDLPAHLDACGFDVEYKRLLSFSVSPQDALWRWPESFFPIVARTLVEKGVLTSQDEDDFLNDWKQRSSSPNSLFCTPSIIEVVARKRS